MPAMLLGRQAELPYVHTLCEHCSIRITAGLSVLTYRRSYRWIQCSVHIGFSGIRINLSGMGKRTVVNGNDRTISIGVGSIPHIFYFSKRRRFVIPIIYSISNTDIQQMATGGNCFLSIRSGPCKADRKTTPFWLLNLSWAYYLSKINSTFLNK